MAGSLFGTVVRNNAELLEQRGRVLRCNSLPRWNFTPFDIITLDEFQDCTEIIYWLTNCFILANKREADGHSPQLVILGDERQSIYRFRGADHCYLSLAPAANAKRNVAYTAFKFSIQSGPSDGAFPPKKNELFPLLVSLHWYISVRYASHLVH